MADINIINISGGFLGTLTIVFIVLKLTHNIEWSWWWVLSPLWIPLLLVIVILLFTYISYLIWWQ